MKRTKSYFLILLLLLVFVSLILSCGGGGGGSTDTPTTNDADGQTNLSGMVQPDPSDPSSNGTHAGATVYIIGQQDMAVQTDSNGNFSLSVNAQLSGTVLSRLFKKRAAPVTQTYGLVVISAAKNHGKKIEVPVTDGQLTPVAPILINTVGTLSGKALLQNAPNNDHTGITVFIPGTSFSAITAADGSYTISNVPSGTYDFVRAEKFGSSWNYAVASNVTVNTNADSRIPDMLLQLSSGANGNVLINGGNEYTTSPTVTLSIATSSNAVLMQISEDPNMQGAAWQPVQATMQYTFQGDYTQGGTAIIYAKFSDPSNLESSPISDSIVIDPVPPVNCSVAINNFAVATNSTTVTLSLTAQDAVTQVAEMMISNDPDMAGATWEAYQTSRSWTIPSGDGTKAVYVKFRDIVGNATTSAVSASIVLDTQRPTAPSVSFQEGAYARSRQVTLNLAVSGATSMMISEDSGFSGASYASFAATTSWALSNGDGQKTIYVKFRDDAGNEPTSVASASIVLDTVLPTTPVITEGNQPTSQLTFTVHLSTPSTDANFKTCQVFGGQYLNWTDTTDTSSFSFNLTQEGPNILWVRGKDHAGNEGAAAGVTITRDTTSPNIINIAVSTTGTTATIQWNTNEAASGVVSYGTDSSYGSTVTTTAGTTHTATITGLTPLSTYHFAVSSTDLAGNPASSVDTTFKTGMEVSGVISSNTHWTTADSPVIVTNYIRVESGATLTIDPGVSVKFDTANSYLQIDGTLVAVGTEANKITFTSNRVNPAAGDWGSSIGIKFTNTSADAVFDGSGNYLSGSVLRYTVVEYGIGVTLEAASPFVDHNLIRYNGPSSGAALFFNGYGSGSPRLTNNVIANRGLNVQQGSPVVEHNTITGNIFMMTNPTMRYNVISGCITVALLSPGAVLNRNNIDGTGCSYALEMRFDANEDIDATNNYWSTTNQSTIDAMIWDTNDNGTLRLAIVAPILTGPELTAGPLP